MFPCAFLNAWSLLCQEHKVQTSTTQKVIKIFTIHVSSSYALEEKSESCETLEEWEENGAVTTMNNESYDILDSVDTAPKIICAKMVSNEKLILSPTTLADGDTSPGRCSNAHKMLLIGGMSH